jgi:hypothetical protein
MMALTAALITIIRNSSSRDIAEMILSHCKKTSIMMRSMRIGKELQVTSRNYSVKNK